MKSFDIAIHGAGFVGQALALALARLNFSVALIGKKTQNSEYTDIRAFALGSAAQTFLQSLGAWPDAQHVTPVVSMEVFGDKGGAVQFGKPLSTPATPDQKPLNWIVDVPQLALQLQTQVAHQPHITRFTEDDGLQATVHAVCEGKQTDANIINYPQYAIAARLDCEQSHNQIARQWFNDKGEVLALLPLHGQQVALVWSQATDQAQQLAKVDNTDFAHALEVACGKALGAMRLTTERALWPLTLSQPRVWTADNWVLAGDAAHTLHPLAGQGLNLGLGDAAMLAQTLHSIKVNSPLFKPTPTQLSRALRRYARVRQAAASQMQYATDGLHLLFARQSVSAQLLRNTGMNLFNRLDWFKHRLAQRAQ